MTPLAGRPYPLGVHVEGEGTNFAVSSEIADAIEVCLFDAEGEEERVELPSAQRAYLARLRSRGRPGPALRAAGARPVGTDEGLRCNPAKLLLDPHATAIDGEVELGRERFSATVSMPRRGQRH